MLNDAGRIAGYRDGGGTVVWDQSGFGLNADATVAVGAGCDRYSVAQPLVWHCR